MFDMMNGRAADRLRIILTGRLSRSTEAIDDRRDRSTERTTPRLLSAVGQMESAVGQTAGPERESDPKPFEYWRRTCAEGRAPENKELGSR